MKKGTLGEFFAGHLLSTYKFISYPCAVVK